MPLEINSPQKLPKMLPGSVCAQRVKCGRPNCRCAQGRPHGPYFYRFYREGGRLTKRYVRQADVEEVRAQINARRWYRLHRLASQRQARRLEMILRYLGKR